MVARPKCNLSWRVALSGVVRDRTLLRTRTYGKEMAAWLAALAAPGAHPLTLEA